MDRRLFLLGAGALTACGPRGDPSLDVVCDPGLEPPLLRARLANRVEGAFSLSAQSPQQMLQSIEAGRADMVVTREEKIADRLQRQAEVRLEDRWKVKILGADAYIVVTRERGARKRALAFAKWLAGEEATRHLASAEDPVASPPL